MLKLLLLLDLGADAEVTVEVNGANVEVAVDVFVLGRTSSWIVTLFVMELYDREDDGEARKR